MPTSPTPALCQVHLDAFGLSFTCTQGESVLDAAYAAGVALPYACRRGICGLCAASLLQGEVRPVDRLPMTNARCGSDEVLLCRCTPVTVQLRMQPKSAEPLPTGKRLPPLRFD